MLVADIDVGATNGLTSKGVGNGAGEILGFGAGEIAGVGKGATLAFGIGFILGVGPELAAVGAGCAPDGIPGAAGRDPSWLAPVPSGRLAAGPPVDGPGWDGLFC